MDTPHPGLRGEGYALVEVSVTVPFCLFAGPRWFGLNPRCSIASLQRSPRAVNPFPALSAWSALVSSDHAPVNSGQDGLDRLA